MSKEHVARFGVSLKKDLLAILDKMVKERGYTNRSLAIADMVRDEYVEYSQQQPNLVVAGTVTLVYDHHTRNVLETLTHLQHDHSTEIISTLHVHLDHHNCLEVLVVRGKVPEIKALADRLIGAKGVKHGKLCMTTTGANLPS